MDIDSSDLIISFKMNKVSFTSFQKLITSLRIYIRDRYKPTYVIPNILLTDGTVTEERIKISKFHRPPQANEIKGRTSK